MSVGISSTEQTVTKTQIYFMSVEISASPEPGVQITRQVDTALTGTVYQITGRDVVQYCQIKSFTTQKAKLEPDLWAPRVCLNSLSI